eukprot:1871850-Prymnesium_polylepis.1
MCGKTSLFLRSEPPRLAARLTRGSCHSGYASDRACLHVSTEVGYRLCHCHPPPDAWPKAQAVGSLTD